ncbi:uncharacterized protein DFL_006630 [Arthrobotrys flagrans]|uniref:Uncharacterized protein n=1 Tax=Arthrobotrys flagrans TaxID=97331 RepID=A0A436ZTC4_ARTFL|nr:hypothetical protein DFL_006630 [Arthrobotrys flagrans]
MRATLESLPVDVKLLILLNIPDYLSLQALTSVSHGFATTYNHYESLVSTEPLYADALIYEKESFFLACYSDILSGPTATNLIKWQKFRKIVSSYVDAEKSLWRADYESRTYRQEFIDRGEETKKRLVDNHRAILQHCEHFMKTERYPRLFRDRDASGNRKYDRCKGERSVTLEERSRIVRAFYRLWILVVIYTSETDGGFGDTPWYTYDDSLHALLAHWGFWRVKHIQIVAMHLREQMRPIFKHFQPNNKELLEQFSSNYLWEGRPYPDGRPYGNNELRKAKYFYQKFHFSAFLLTSFPHSSLPFLQSPTPDLNTLTPIFTPLSTLVRTATDSVIHGNTTENTNRLYNCLFFPDRIFDEFRLTAINTLSDISKIKREDTYLVSNSFSDPRTPSSRKRLCRPQRNGAYHKYYIKRGPEAALIAWQGLELSNPNSEDSDYYAAIWDDLRLKEWGYQFPVLERRVWDIRRMTDRMVQKFDAMITMDESIPRSPPPGKETFNVVQVRQRWRMITQ